jgi:hypothetical protein
MWCSSVAVMLTVRSNGKRRNGYPGHRELERPAALQEAVAEDQHHVRHRRQAEVAVERACKTRRIAAYARQLDVAFLVCVHAPEAAIVASQVELAPPTFAATGDAQARGDERRACLELVIEPVRKRRRADGDAARAHLLLPMFISANSTPNGSSLTHATARRVSEAGTFFRLTPSCGWCIPCGERPLQQMLP